MDNIIGKEYNYLKVLNVIPRPKEVDTKYQCWQAPSFRWLECECQKCGNVIKVPERVVLNGSVKSCGCLRVEHGKQSMKAMREKYFYPQNGKDITYMGMTMNILQWSKYTGIPRSTLRYRLKRGMPLSAVFEGARNIGFTGADSAGNQPEPDTGTD